LAPCRIRFERHENAVELGPATRVLDGIICSVHRQPDLGPAQQPVTLSGSQGFLTVIDPDGTFTERVYLTVVSDFGVSETQVKLSADQTQRATFLFSDLTKRR